MKISYKNIANLFEEKPSLKDVSSKLFQLGHEHDIFGNILDIEFTPNRGDCLSLHGVSRDLSVFYKKKNNLEIYDKEINELDLKFENTATKDCPKISFLKIQIMNPVEFYKDYLEDYFIEFDIKKNNFFADITNYLSYELGQPTHAYDFKKIEDKIVLKNINEDKIFKTLLDKEIKLSGQNLVFSSGDDVINLAGIMGGKKTACSNKTDTALIECAYFMKEKIIGKSLEYDLHSESSYKFERGVDPHCHDFVLRRFIKIVEDHAEIKELSYVTSSYEDINESSIEYDFNSINQILGTNIDEIKMAGILCDLGFIIDNSCIFHPSYRHDIHNMNDIAEEIARVIGYNNIPRKEFKINSTSKESDAYIKENQIRNFFIENGFNEVINIPFSSQKENESIVIDNPLDSNKPSMRINLINSLISNLLYNEKRQKDSIKLFEISDVYTKQDSISHKKKLAIIISGRRGQNFKEFSKVLDFNYMSEISNSLNIDISKIKKIDRTDLDTKIKNPIFGIEIDLKEVDIKTPFLEKELNNDFIKYKKISEFPSTYRDISFLIVNRSKLNDLELLIKSLKFSELKKSFVFDFYEIPDSENIKLGYRFIFQSNDETLTDNLVDDIMHEIIESSLKINGIDIPGLN
tara:strand:- start:110 stop:2011 length:1902 start_codon:yes stop_codon:yes gene_type:complete